MVVSLIVSALWLRSWTQNRRRWRLPSTIPRIPFYLSALYTYKRADRTTFYNACVRHAAEQHGAVLVWNKGRWTILITDPQYLTEVFRNDHVFAKAGPYHKSPGGAAAHLFGLNIIDSHGPLWRHFRSILQRGIQRRIDIRFIRRKSTELAAELVRMQNVASSSGCGVEISLPIQRWALSIYGEYFMDKDLVAGGNELQDALNRLRRLRMSPLLALYPPLERLQWLFPSSRRAFALARSIEAILVGHVDGGVHAKSDIMIYRLNRALSTGDISEFHYRSNLKQLLFAGHENTEVVLNSALWELAKSPEVQDRLWRELCSNLPSPYSARDLGRLPLLAATILETMRLYPPISLTNRATTRDACLGGSLHIPAGTWVGWSAYAVHTNPCIWGPSALDFNPDRWGRDMDEVLRTFRTQQARGRYIPFATHARRCSGSNFAILQLKVALCELVRRLRWARDPGYHFSLLQVCP
ncbi:hypothetical protein HIM_05983 [Hirsutella minnesotensis 3608]|uniref:Cytochrome P450 n=1 Tax=Hirsutella minnesotensis 3608 TaxID=1043627 RepID=A0A0F7ZUC7_9HYPO|nr:hypothetical protein HIM_05983 [Hirsutella minnesotensis 3608]